MPCTGHAFSNTAPFPIHMRLVELASFAGNIAGRHPLKDFARNPSNGSPAQLPRAREFASTNELVNGGAPKARNFPNLREPENRICAMLFHVVAYALLVMAGSLTPGPAGRILFPERSTVPRNVPLTP